MHCLIFINHQNFDDLLRSKVSTLYHDSISKPVCIRGLQSAIYRSLSNNIVTYEYFLFLYSALAHAEKDRELIGKII